MIYNIKRGDCNLSGKLVIIVIIALIAGGYGFAVADPEIENIFDSGNTKNNIKIPADMTARFV
jgi:hypothetical protein